MTEKNNIKIILIDDHRWVHQVMAEMLDFYDDIDLIAQGNNGNDAIELCNLYTPDLVLMDVVMPSMDGIEATKRILEKHPNTKILAMSSFEDSDAVRGMLENGAIGYILKNSSVLRLYNTIRSAADGQSILSPEIVHTLIEPSQNDFEQVLTPRETEVLAHLAAGLTNGEIALELTVSVSTIKFHINNILIKMGVKTRAEALVIAAKNNLV